MHGTSARQYAVVEFPSFELAIRHLAEQYAVLLPEIVRGAFHCLGSINGWVKANSHHVTVLPNPAQNLSLPLGIDELAIALRRKKQQLGCSEDAIEWASRFGLDQHHLERPVSTLSGGEQMRLSLAKASAYALQGHHLLAFSPYFWLDVEHRRLVDQALTAGNGANLVLLEGENDHSTQVDEGPFPEEGIPWQLTARRPLLHLNPVPFDGGTRAKRLLINLEGSIELKSPTLLTGANGSGKSTLAGLMAGVVKPQSGALSVSAGRAFVGAARLLQQDCLSQLFGLPATDHLPRVFKNDRELRKKSRELYSQMEAFCSAELRKSDGVFGEREKPITVLQAKLALLAERLISSPPVLVLDEPGWCLTRAASRALGKTAAHFSKQRQVALVLVSHHSEWWGGLCRQQLSLEKSTRHDGTDVVDLSSHEL